MLQTLINGLPRLMGGTVALFILAFGILRYSAESKVPTFVKEFSHLEFIASLTLDMAIGYLAVAIMTSVIQHQITTTKRGTPHA